MQSFPVMSGETLILPLTIKDNDAALVNMTGASARFAMARRPKGTPVIDSDASPATATVVVTAANGGPVTVTITDENTEALEGDYYYECKVTDSGGQEAVTNRGWISFAPNLT